ncbi:hypothetical protein OC861_000568 [Tilletia horrida]|nr:hypothetical protein OC861_000568 [Tilletia horrida]
MSFQFGFAGSEELELEVGEDPQVHYAQASRPAHVVEEVEEPARKLSLEALLKTLPPALSYSPIFVPIAAQAPERTEHRLVLARRDLFDARFQMLHHDSDISADNNNPSENLEPTSDRQIGTMGIPGSSSSGAVGADSDLVPGVYEGGLKTWECASDLIAELHSRRQDAQLVLPGSKIIESATDSGKRTILDLADFNAQVLRLVTLPNLILTWYFSPASKAFQEQAKDHAPYKNAIEQETSAEVPGDLELSPELLAAFQTSLDDRQIQLRFFSGPWSRLSALLFPSSTDSADQRRYDLILSSETVYSLSTLPSLVNILYDCSTGGRKAAGDSITGDGGGRADCLVAAKVLYFGVGGGVHSFVQAVQAHERRRGSVQTVRQINSGVGRAVLAVHWD